MANPGSSNDYICGANGTGDEESKLGSQVMHVASSLDGRSTTEYEMLMDVLFHWHGIDVKDLVLNSGDEEVKTPKGSCKSAGQQIAEQMATLSPRSTVTSDISFELLKTPHPPEKETIKSPSDRSLTPIRPGASNSVLRAEAVDTTEDRGEDKSISKIEQDDTSLGVGGCPRHGVDPGKKSTTSKLPRPDRNEGYRQDLYILCRKGKGSGK